MGSLILQIKDTSRAAQEPTDKTTSERTKESSTVYAFAISVDTTQVLPNLSFAKLNSLFLQSGTPKEQVYCDKLELVR